jgi:HEPN domain-containing protein
MERKKLVEFWLSEAEEARVVAKHLFGKKDYSYSLFFGHLAIEKILKAIYVKRKDEQVPRLHNLPRLAEEAGLDVTPDILHNLIRITAYNLEARYPDYNKRIPKKMLFPIYQRRI